MATEYAIPPLPDHPGTLCVELHREEALSLPAARVRTAFELPVKVIVEEGGDLGRLAQMYWSPGDRTLPGLERVSFRIPPTAPARLITLSRACREMTLVVIVGRGNLTLRVTVEEAEEVLRLLRHHLGFWLDDGVETLEDLHFARLAAEHGDTLSIDRLSAALYDYTRLAEQLGPAMMAANMTTWDPAIIGRAFALHETLQAAHPATERTDLDLRNRLLTLLQEEMARVRRAAEYLWSREHPTVYRMFLSAWMRNRKLAARRRRLNAEAEAASATESPSEAPVLTEA